MNWNKTFKKDLIQIGEILGQLRAKKGYSTIKEFAEKHDLPAIQYWRIEKGKANVTLKSLFRILSIHNISFHEFFCMLTNETSDVAS